RSRTSGRRSRGRWKRRSATKANADTYSSPRSTQSGWLATLYGNSDAFRPQPDYWILASIAAIR
ncbi:MAG TPA: hypothetical protein PL064_10030, partial [Thermogutta sp.]|nr:hypothetical protein [Thermogutta sp.]